MSARRIFIAGICFLVLASIGVFYFSSKKQSVPAPNTPAPASATTTPETVQTRVVPDGWREYRNVTYHFSLFYPHELEVKEYPEEGNAFTITFQNVKEQKGFQIFVVPYQESQVSEERFKQDLPSGVRTNVSDVTIDGATGAAFYSTNAMFGETREIWFIRGGYLFEVTTLKPLTAWMEEILLSWKFL
ncbi:MAG: hypothetical protein AAB545_00920 [Patescibacteria group bacterium]